MQLNKEKRKRKKTITMRENTAKQYFIGTQEIRHIPGNNFALIFSL